MKKSGGIPVDVNANVISTATIAKCKMCRRSHVQIINLSYNSENCLLSFKTENCNKIPFPFPYEVEAVYDFLLFPR